METGKAGTEPSRMANCIGNRGTGEQKMGGRSGPGGAVKMEAGGVVTRALSVRQGAWSLDEEEIFKTDLAGGDAQT